ncbi:MAG: RNA polymerase sigma factor [Oscillospiraceae bacterium]|nr:RNA polymerase sigma factor [Oscillospiraceae bacterium]MBR6678021.1 RNA polymerase sigma factor [Oscillospiraceae bacterium]
MSQSSSREALIAAAYDRHANMLYRVAMSHLGNSEDAQDAVQDAFARYISAAPTFSDEEQERAWLIRVTVNRSLDLLRQKKVRSYVPLEEAGEIAAETQEEDGLHSLLQTLAHIPEKHRSAIVLHHLEGFPVEKTAQMLGISVSAVKMRLSRGREALKELLQEGKRHVH